MCIMDLGWILSVIIEATTAAIQLEEEHVVFLRLRAVTKTGEALLAFQG